jgi:ribosomal-protein-alanine N-acetyltransferase
MALWHAPVARRGDRPGGPVACPSDGGFACPFVQPPWTDGEFADLLAKDTVFGFVARHIPAGSENALGFVLARAVAGEAEILTITVAPEWQRRGLGRQLMDAVLARSHSDRAESVFLEVDETNAVAIRLYRKLGFFQVGGRPDYYRDAAGGRTAALVMRRDLG